MQNHQPSAPHPFLNHIRKLEAASNLKLLCQLPAKVILQIIESAILVLKQEKTLVKIKSPVKICGDIHGQIFDLLNIFKEEGNVKTQKYLFLGDYVDRGSHSLEVMILLLAYKVVYPEQIYLLRGNHEDLKMNRDNGFIQQCQKKYPKYPEVYLCFLKCFSYLSFIAVVNDVVVCMHGGISQQVSERFDQIQNCQKPISSQYDLMADLWKNIIWSDPTEQNGFRQNRERQVGSVFGPDVTREFLKKYGFKLLCRGHSLEQQGFRFYKQSLVLTIFSASNYHQNRYHNKGSLLSLDENLKGTIRQYKARTQHIATRNRPNAAISIVGIEIDFKFDPPEDIVLPSKVKLIQLSKPKREAKGKPPTKNKKLKKNDKNTKYEQQNNQFIPEEKSVYIEDQKTEFCVQEYFSLRELQDSIGELNFYEEKQKEQKIVLEQKQKDQMSAIQEGQQSKKEQTNKQEQYQQKKQSNDQSEIHQIIQYGQQNNIQEPKHKQQMIFSGISSQPQKQQHQAELEQNYQKGQSQAQIENEMKQAKILNKQNHQELKQQQASNIQQIEQEEQQTNQFEDHKQQKHQQKYQEQQKQQIQISTNIQPESKVEQSQVPIQQKQSPSKILINDVLPSINPDVKQISNENEPFNRQNNQQANQTTQIKQQDYNNSLVQNQPIVTISQETHEESQSVDSPK